MGDITGNEGEAAAASPVCHDGDTAQDTLTTRVPCAVNRGVTTDGDGKKGGDGVGEKSGRAVLEINDRFVIERRPRLEQLQQVRREPRRVALPDLPPKPQHIIKPQIEAKRTGKAKS